VQRFSRKLKCVMVIDKYRVEETSGFAAWGDLDTGGREYKCWGNYKIENMSIAIKASICYYLLRKA
jgi:hypothetical protein